MSDKALRYGWVEGDGKGREVKVAADQYIHRLGGKFVRTDSAGNVVLATTISAASNLLGWAEVPKHATGKDAWKSSSTAGEDKVFVVYGGGTNKFEIPNSATEAAANATLIGKGGAIQTYNATYGMIQKFAYKATAASCCLSAFDFNASNNTVVVGIRPSKLSPA